VLPVAAAATATETTATAATDSRRSCGGRELHRRHTRPTV